MSQPGSIQRSKRFINELRRKIPSVSLGIGESGLSYSDLLKLDARATEFGNLVEPAIDRVRWVRSILEQLENWAAGAIQANEATDIPRIKACIIEAELEFTKAFCKTVPLYKLITTSNRKSLRILDEYNSRCDLWIPLPVANATAELQIRILSSEDQVRIGYLHEKWVGLVGKGYFALEEVLKFLKGLHPDDVRCSSAFPLLSKALKLQGIDFNSIQCDPFYVRVRPSVVHKLIAVVALSSPADDPASVPANFASEIRKTVERTGDVQFKKLCEKRSTELSLKMYPSKVDVVLSLLDKPFGKRKLETRRTNRKIFVGQKEVSMRTRSRAAKKKRKVKLNGVTVRQLEKLRDEGDSLVRFSKKQAVVTKTVSLLESEIDKLNLQRTELESTLSRSDLSAWTTKVEKNPDFLWLYKYDIQDSLTELVQKIKGKHPGLLRDFFADIKRIVPRLRLENELVDLVLENRKLTMQQAEDILSSVRPEETKHGLLNWLLESYQSAKNKLRVRFTTFHELEEFVNSLSESSNSISLQIDIGACPEFARASELLIRSRTVHELSSDFLTQIGLLDDVSEIFEVANSIDHSNLRSLSGIIMSLEYLASGSVQLEGQWINTVFALDWIVRARRAMNENNMNSLIELHRKADIIAPFVNASAELHQLWDSVCKIVDNISALIDGLKKGKFENLALLDQRHVCVCEVEKVKMDLEDVCAHVWRTPVRIETVKRTLDQISSFFDRFGVEPSDETAILINHLNAITKANEELSDCANVSQLEQLLSILHAFESAEIEKAKRDFEKTELVMAEVIQVSKRTDTSVTPIARLLELLEAKYLVLKKSGKLKIGIKSEIVMKFLTNIHSTATHLLMRLVSQQAAPKWVHLYILRAVGGWLNVPDIKWLNKQLDLCNEIIKSGKNSATEFAKARFLIPMFHFCLFEPFEKVRLNLEQKQGIEIKLFFEQSVKRLESIAFIDKSGKLIDRLFPKPNAASRNFLVEPEDSTSSLSEEFEKRRVPGSLTECVAQMLLVAKSLLRDARKSDSLLSKASTGFSQKSIASSSSSSPHNQQSFTKFLSSSFASLDLSTESGERPSTPSGEEWINKIDQLILNNSDQSGGNILNRYVDMIVSQKSDPLPSIPLPPPSESKPLISLPAVLPGFQAPPSAPPQTVKSIPDIIIEEDSIVPLVAWAWRGEIIGPKHAYRIHISLLPTFRSPTDYTTMKKVLADHSSWTFEGSLSVSKFGEHYAKLMHPAHRAKREPYGFLIACPEDKQEALLDHIGANTAHAFAIIVAPYKVKLWIVSVDGKIPFHPLPLKEGLVFGFMEMPIALFLPSAALENIFTLPEIEESVQRLKNQLSSLNAADPLVERLHPPIQPVPLEVVSVYSSSHDAIPEPLPPPTPREPEFKRLRTEEPSSWPPQQPEKIPSMPSAFFSRPLTKASSLPPVPGGFVIGAPSTGPALDQLPNVQKGLCRFFNTMQGCQSGSRCRYVHKCSLCGSEAHPAVFHDRGQLEGPRQSFYPPIHGHLGNR